MNTSRLLSLDIFRGFTVVAMLMVDYPGSWDTRFPIFDHARWNGFNAPDFIFPSFLFIMGVAMVFSFGKKLEANVPKSKLYKDIAIRTALLLILGYITNIFFQEGEYAISTLRLLGVLQRIGIVYFISSLLYLHLTRQKLIYSGILILVGYWVLLTCIPVPGFGKPNLDIFPDKVIANLPAWIDMKVLGNLAWQYSKPYDPEGILSTLPSIATAIIGMITGFWLRSEQTMERKTIGMYGFGLFFLLLGLIWNIWFPINKNIWTSSFVLYAGGWSLLIFATFYWVIDGVKKSNLFFVLCSYFGRNAIATFFLCAMVGCLLNRIMFHQLSLTVLIYKNLFVSWLPAIHASWVFSVFHLFFWASFFWYLDKKRIYIKL